MLAVCEVACELPEEATVGRDMQVAKALIVFVIQSMSSFDKCSRCVVHSYHLTTQRLRCVHLTQTLQRLPEFPSVCRMQRQLKLCVM